MCAKDRCFKIITSLCLMMSSVATGQGIEPPVRARRDLVTQPLEPDYTVALASPSDVAVDPSDDDSSSDDELDALLSQDISNLRRTSVTPALDVEVTTVSRQQSTVGRSPAAVFVVSEEMIRRSGARTIPEVLRMVPGLHVANIDGNKWSISSRGNAGRFANKLLVQIDGRTVYTPLFGGVFWDVQDLLLDDIKRIEVIRGPGATIWGANAVNGVINVITKSASETHGVYVNAGGGSTQQAFTGARVGGRTEQGVDWRVSGKWYQRDKFFDPDARAEDGSQQGRVGFRTDWKTDSNDQVTFQGDWYKGTNNHSHDSPIFGFKRSTEEVAGGNVLGRWSRLLSDDSDVSLQFYYDRTDRITQGFDQDTNTIDLDFQHRFSPLKHHKVIWGLKYRTIWDRLKNNLNPALISVSPERRTLDRYSAFVQDELSLVDDELYLTLGAKISHNTYTKFEVQPSIRMLWLPNETSALWAAASRAVRTPTRISEDLVLLGPALPSPPFPPNTPTRVLGNRDVVSEELIAYEIGYRKQVSRQFSWDAAAFYNVYDDLLAARNVVPAVGLPFIEFFSGNMADTYGIELSSELQMNSRWKLRSWYSYLKMNAKYDPASNQLTAGIEGSTPINQAYLMSSWDVGRSVEVDLIARYVDVIRFQQIPGYLTMDLRCAWRPSRHFELSVVGQNLLDSYHPEYAGSGFTGEIATEVPRGVYGMMTYRY